MLYRVLSAASLLALAGCQPYYPYPQYSSYGYPSYYRPLVPVSVVRPAAPPTAMELNAQRAGVAPGLAATPPALVGGPFRDTGMQLGELSFSAGDPVRRSAVANYGNRHIEWLTLKNGGTFVYERLEAGAFTGPSDAELLRADLDWPAFRQRGITFDAAKLERVGPFTYLAQASPMYNCVIFRGRLPQGSAPAARQAYGNVCYAKAAKDLAGVRAEMVDMLSRVRVGDGATRIASATGAVPAALTLAASPSAGTSSGAGQAVAIEQCRSRVSFSGTPALMDLPGVPAATRFIEYRYANGAYSETASCSCKKDIDYAKVSQFDAVDNARSAAERNGYTLQIATFDDTPELGKELRYEARQESGDVTLVGRNFFQRCSLSVQATAASDAGLAKARKFLASVAAGTLEAAAPAAALSGSTQQPVISTAAKPETPPVAAPREPVSEAAVDSATPAAAKAQPAASAVQPAVDQTSGDTTMMRLRRLKALRDQQLITPDEYDAKRKGIIDAL
ncbi:MAG TPA: SHOCT domain-containing protein [Stellaceae bacterium]|nr:SHOCT domain-containing protein [Stellaceae bacterium]